jgi:hypothetical protein
VITIRIKKISSRIMATRSSELMRWKMFAQKISYYLAEYCLKKLSLGYY